MNAKDKIWLIHLESATGVSPWESTYHPDKIKETRPDYLLIFAWNIKEEIMDQMSYIREWNGKFVVLIPGVKVYS